jgi:hypothetical protein
MMINIQIAVQMVKTLYQVTLAVTDSVAGTPLGGAAAAIGTVAGNTDGTGTVVLGPLASTR